MTYLIIAVVAIISPLLALAEPIAVLAGLSAKVSWLGVVVALAVGQSIGFCLMYVFGEHIVTRWRWLARKFERVNVQEYQHRRTFFTSAAALFGMPPLTALALAGPLYEPRFVRFMTVVFGGRLVRFLVFGGAATLFADSIDRSIIPAWLAAYL